MFCNYMNFGVLLKMKITQDVFWEKFNSIHLYSTKGEALFKIAAITFSWRWSVFVEKIPSEITREMGIALHLFSLALIMEYVMKLISSSRIIPKIFPLFLCFFNLYVFITAAFIVNGTVSVYSKYTSLYNLTYASMVILWLDLAIQLLFEKADVSIENKLSSIRIGDNDE